MPEDKEQQNDVSDAVDCYGARMAEYADEPSVTEAELPPCPFCGGEVFLSKYRDMITDELVDMDVACEGCGVEMRHRGFDENDLATRWSRRA